MFVLASIAVASTVYYPARWSALMYSASLALFVAVVTVFQTNTVAREGHYINGSILAAVAFVLSRILYRARDTACRRRS